MCVTVFFKAICWKISHRRPWSCIFRNWSRLSHTRKISLSFVFNRNTADKRFSPARRQLSPFSTGRLFSREATFSFVGIAFADVISDADKGKSRFARKKLPSGKRALLSYLYWTESHTIFHITKNAACRGTGVQVMTSCSRV